jgi:serine/threonine protein kinase
MIDHCANPTLRRPYGARARIPSGAAGEPAGELLAGRYRLAEPIGRGMTGRTGRARDELLTRDVVVKRLPRRQPPGMTEAHVAARVRHAGVAAVHDLVQQDGSWWMVMDHYSGGTLAALLRRRHRLSPALTAALGLQLVAALGAVHAAGIVHCDVKPANLLLDADGRLVLVDFGIAEGGGVRPVDREEGFIVGSPSFLAPELVRGEAVRPAADLWSLGATLYVAVEGRPPFAGDDAAETFTAVLHDPPPAPCHAERLGPLLTGLLAKDPAGRPSPDAIRTALAEISLGQPRRRSTRARHRHGPAGVSTLPASGDARR